jgi:methionine synthase II (cobalamin-independent)
MLRTTVVGSWPPEERYRAPLALYFSGQMDQSESETLLKVNKFAQVGRPTKAAMGDRR